MPSTNPTQETCAGSCRSYGLQPGNMSYIIQTVLEKSRPSSGDRSCVVICPKCELFPNLRRSSPHEYLTLYVIDFREPCLDQSSTSFRGSVRLAPYQQLRAQIELVLHLGEGRGLGRGGATNVGQADI